MNRKLMEYLKQLEKKADEARYNEELHVADRIHNSGMRKAFREIINYLEDEQR